MKTITAARVAAACLKIKTLRNATRLWNMIDGQEEPESLWAEMARVIPWAFRDPTNANTMKFVYRNRKHDAEFSGYARTRKQAQAKLAAIGAWMRQVSEVIKATPAKDDEAGYIELDIVQQLDAKLGEVLPLLCNDAMWEDLSLARSAVGLKG